MPRVGFAFAQVEDVAVSAIPIVEIAAVLQSVRIETAKFFLEAPRRVRAGQEAIRRSGVQAVILRDVPGLGFSAARLAARVLPISSTPAIVLPSHSV